MRRRRSPRWAVAALLAAGAFAAAACGEAETRQGSDDLPPRDERGRAPGEAEVQTTGPGPVPATPEDLLLAPSAAQRAIDDIVGELGPVNVREIVLYPDRALAEVQDPEQPENLDDYSYEGGELSGPEPVHLSSFDDVAAEVFSLSAVRWDRVPELVQAALVQLAIDEAAASHVIVARDLPFSPDVVIRVYVNGPRRSGFLDATADGTVLEAVVA